MVQWVMDASAMAWVTAAVGVQSLSRCSGLKHLVLVQLQQGFNLWPGNFHMLWVWPTTPAKKKSKKNPSDSKMHAENGSTLQVPELAGMWGLILGRVF